jgi:hypothetical protein
MQFILPEQHVSQTVENNKFLFSPAHSRKYKQLIGFPVLATDYSKICTGAFIF